MPIEFNNAVKARISHKIIRGAFSRFLKIAKLSRDCRVSVALVSSSEIKKLNKLYRGQNLPTDVLSFSNLDCQKFPNDFDLGEVIICYPVAVKQAKAKRHSISREIEILLVHGLVHLLGYDHETEHDAAVMQELEKKILSEQ
jgi:probable rRNA maturation factor